MTGVRVLRGCAGPRPRLNEAVVDQIGRLACEKESLSAIHEMDGSWLVSSGNLNREGGPALPYVQVAFLSLWSLRAEHPVQPEGRSA